MGREIEAGAEAERGIGIGIERIVVGIDVVRRTIDLLDAGTMLVVIGLVIATAQLGAPGRWPQ